MIMKVRVFISLIFILQILSYCSFALTFSHIKRKHKYYSHAAQRSIKSTFALNNAAVPLPLGSTSLNSTSINFNGKVDKSVAVVQKLNIFHFTAILNLAAQQFLPECNSILDKFVLIRSITYIFIPKLLFPSYMGHTLIGLATSVPSTNLYLTRKEQIIGFVDVSLQRNAGDLDTLDNKSLFQREQSLQKGESLTPYLCNLLVSANFRKRGFGRKLVQAAEAEAASWGHSELRLHVETKSVAALCLYLGEDFQVLRKLQDGSLLYLGKKFSPQKMMDTS